MTSWRPRGKEAYLKPLEMEKASQSLEGRGPTQNHLGALIQLTLMENRALRKVLAGEMVDSTELKSVLKGQKQVTQGVTVTLAEIMTSTDWLTGWQEHQCPARERR